MWKFSLNTILCLIYLANIGWRYEPVNIPSTFSVRPKFRLNNQKISKNPFCSNFIIFDNVILSGFLFASHSDCNILKLIKSSWLVKPALVLSISFTCGKGRLFLVVKVISYNYLTSMTDDNLLWTTGKLITEKKLFYFRINFLFFYLLFHTISWMPSNFFIVV